MHIFLNSWNKRYTKPILIVEIHTCDEFESGIREIFLSFQGGF